MEAWLLHNGESVGKLGHSLDLLRSELPPLNYPHLQALVADQVTQYSHRDILVLIGQSSSQMEISDCRRDEIRIMPRYSILATPVWIQDRDGPNEFWDGRKLVDSSALGDAVASQWWMYTRCFGDEWTTVYPARNDLGGIERRLLTSRSTHSGGRNRVHHCAGNTEYNRQIRHRPAVWETTRMEQDVSPTLPDNIHVTEQRDRMADGSAGYEIPLSRRTNRDSGRASSFRTR